MHIVRGVADGLIAGTKREQQRLCKALENDREYQRSDQKEGKAVPHDRLSGLGISTARFNGCSGGAAHCHQRGKSGHDDNQRKADAHTGEGQLSHGFHRLDVANEDAVHQIVEHVDDLGCDRGE